MAGRMSLIVIEKNLLTKSKKPLYAATKVFNVSSATASSALTKCWAHSTNKTSALLRSVKHHGQGFKRVYASGRASLHSSASSSSSSPGGNEFGNGVPFFRRLLNAWTQTPTKWYPLPIAVGAILLVVVQYRKKSKRASQELHVDQDGVEVIKLKGPWQVHVLGALPLRNMSRLWGYVNSLELPVWFRPYGFRLFALIFDCNLGEIDRDDLTAYPSLGDFFYRKLKPGVRPVDDAILVSPADGKILHFGTIKGLQVEQVKGMTYSLDALLGVERPNSPPPSIAVSQSNMPVVDDKEFANINDIEYSLDELLGSSSGTTTPKSSSLPKKLGDQTDASVVEDNVEDALAHDASVAIQMGVRPSLSRASSTSSIAGRVKPGNALFFTVIYLAPGDYHRFHSPTAWVVERRRHFVGELFSVSPYMAKRLQNLFVLNERVALLGRWRYGLFTMVPVGATNVGSIIVNFDRDLRTNVPQKRKDRMPPGTYTEAVYSAASPLLGGQPLTFAQEMGGFKLGSTIVLVFEAPETFQFSIKPGQKIKVGNRLGDVEKDKNV